MKFNKSVLIFIGAVILILVCFLVPKLITPEHKYSKKDVKISFEDKDVPVIEDTSDTESEEDNKEPAKEGTPAEELGNTETESNDIIESTEENSESSTETEPSTELSEEELEEMRDDIKNSGDAPIETFENLSKDTVGIILEEYLQGYDDENLAYYISDSCKDTLDSLGITDKDKTGEVVNLNLELNTFDYKVGDKSYNLIYTITDGLITSISLK